MLRPGRGSGCLALVDGNGLADDVAAWGARFTEVTNTAP
jgi:hypothetical protein